MPLCFPEPVNMRTILGREFAGGAASQDDPRGVKSAERPTNDGGQPSTARRLERYLDVCEGMIDICAALFNVSGRELRKPGRTGLGVSRVRQIAMYVSHVALGVGMGDVGRGFGRDRTTVVHACHLIEDLRDDEDFDRIVVTIERIAIAAFRAKGRG